jgi:hypothetical protein
MTSTTSELGTRHGHGTTLRLRRIALAAGSLLAAIGSRWNDFVDSGQLGPDAERTIGRRPGSRERSRRRLTPLKRFGRSDAVT